MKRSILIFLLALTVIARSQSFLPLNSSYRDAYQIGFFNPAPLALTGNLRATVGMNLLHAGLAGDALRNNYASFSLPLGDRNALGARIQYFTADIFRQSEASFLASRALYRDRLAFGISLSLLQHGYNKDNFFLFDMNDPVIANGTSSTVFSAGAGVYLQPFQSLHIGLAANHLNEPDVSLDKSGINQKRIVDAGISYSGLPVVPQADLRLEGEEVMTQIGAHLHLLDRSVRLFAAYARQGDQGSGALAEAELHIKNMGLLYGFQYPLTDGISAISSGSHQIGITFAGGGPQVSPPVVKLENLSSRLQIPQAWLKGKAEGKSGLRAIEIHINDRLWKTIPSAILKQTKTFDISEKIPLEVGRNIIQVTALSEGVSGFDKTFTLFEPEAPRIAVHSARNVQTGDSNYELRYTVIEPNELKNVRIYQESELLEEIKSFPQLSKLDSTRLITLVKGKNRLRIEAQNPWLTAIDSLWIEYRPTEPTPSLTINSNDIPISSSSQIVLNLDLTNAEYIKEVVIKVNGKVVDTTSIKRVKDFFVRRVVGYDSTVVVNLETGSKNLIEAIAFDDQGIPRISRSLNVYHNPFAKAMRYSQRRAFVVGINRYQNSEIPHLNEAVRDGKKFAAVLDTVFHFDRITTYFDEQASSEALYALFSDSLIQAQPGELIVIYFSGHGDKYGKAAANQLGFLMPWDASPTSMAKRVTMNYINGYLTASPAKDVLCIFDACYSGTGILSRPEFTWESLPRRVNYDSLKAETSDRALNLISAAGRSEPAVDGLFTGKLVDGLLGRADRNDDGYITSAELAMYVQKYTSDQARNMFLLEQNPQYGGLTSPRGECVFERRY